VKVENPVAFSFIMQDELYLLSKDKAAYETKVLPEPVVEMLPLPVLETVEVKFNYLGKHKKKFLIIVHYPDLEFMAERHLAALESTLKRLEVSLDDTAIFNRAGYADVSFEQLNAFFTPQKLLILGANALPAGIEMLILNKPHSLNDCRTLYTFGFDEMMESNENKKAFWEQMKQF
jgi:hypothetical protein